MANITQTIPSLTAGISQQPDEQKIPGQVKDLENALPDVTYGLLKRPAGKFVGTLANAGDGKWFHYYRDENEQYIGQVHRNGTVKMWACTQVKNPTTGAVIHEAGAPVNVVDGIGNATYLIHTADSDIQTLTLNDFTYIANRSINTAMDTTSTGSVPVGQFEKEVYVELKAVAYAKQYGLNLFDGTTTNPNLTTTTTATRISVKSSTLDNASSCPNVGTEIYNVGSDDDVYENTQTIFKFQNLDVGTNDTNNFFDTNNSRDHYLTYCPPRWTADTFYRVGDLVTGKPTDSNDESSNHTRVYQLKTGSTAGNSTGTTAPTHTSGDAAIGNHTWTHITDTLYEANNNTFSNFPTQSVTQTEWRTPGNTWASNGGTSTQIYHGLPCITLGLYRTTFPSQTQLDNLVTAWKAETFSGTSINKYNLLPFTISDATWLQITTNHQEAEIEIKFKENGYYDDHRNRIILYCNDLTGTGSAPYPLTIGGNNIESANYNALSTNVGEIALAHGGWSENTLDSGRSDLYFRLTTTGQAVPDETTTATDDYVCRYTTTIDLLHGGSGWQEGDQIKIKHKDAKYVIKVDKISTSKVRANLGLIRPTPTSFDTKTTVTADSILGDMRAAIVAQSGFTDADVEQIGSGLYIKKAAKFSASTPVKELLNVVASQVNDIGDLPSQCKHGMVVEVVNSVADEDNHYVQFHGNGGLDGAGVWEECAKPGRKKRLDYAKMPITLIRTADGDFRLAKLDGKKYHLSQDILNVNATCELTGTNEITVTLTNHGYSVGDSVGLSEDATDRFSGPLPSATYIVTKVESADKFSVESSNITGTSKTYSQALVSGAERYLIDFTSHGITNVENDYNVKFTSSSGALPPSGKVDLWHLANNNVIYINTNADGTSIADTNVTGNVLLINKKIKVAPCNYEHPLWEDALVGDDVTNPEPSFIGKPINKMLFFRNRLALLSEENIILSRPGEFFNFFATSAIQFIASDPIDVSASSTYPATLYDGIQVNAGLILFTKNQQFMLTTDSDILSVQTVKINSISTYNFNSDTNPISLGTTIGFLDNANKNSRFFEMASALREGEPEVVEQSAVVSRLFDNDLKLISNSRENSVIFFSEGDTSTLYGYKYFESINQRKLASWFKWKVTGTISYHCMQDDNLFAVVKDAGDNNNPDYNLLKFSLKPEEDTTFTVDGLYDLHLDHMYKIPTGTLANYTASSDTTAIAIPFENGVDLSGLANHTALTSNSGTSKLFAYNPNSGSLVGTYKQVVNSGTWLLVNGNWSQGSGGASTVIPDIVVGFNYTMKVDIPTLYYQKQSGERWVSDTRADTILHRVKLGFGPVGTYETKLKCLGKTDYNQVFEVTPTSNPYASGITNDETLTTIPIYNRNINTSLTIESTHPTPMTLHHLTWEGTYTDKNYSRV